VKPIEIILTTSWAVIGFFTADFLVDRLDVNGAFLRLVVRIVIVGAFLLILYLFEELKSNARRIEELERQLTGGVSESEHATGDE